MAKIIMAPPFSGKTKYCKDWSQYSSENVWRSNNSGKQVYNNIGLPCGEKIIEINCRDYTDKSGNLNLDSYMKAVKEGIKNNEDIIFIASYKSIRETMEKENIDYYLLYPDPEEKYLKLDWEFRMKESGMSEEEIHSILEKWDEYISDFDKESFPEKYTFTDCVNLNEITVTIMNIIGDYCEIQED